MYKNFKKNKMTYRLKIKDSFLIVNLEDDSIKDLLISLGFEYFDYNTLKKDNQDITLKKANQGTILKDNKKYTFIYNNLDLSDVFEVTKNIDCTIVVYYVFYNNLGTPLLISQIKVDDIVTFLDVNNEYPFIKFQIDENGKYRFDKHKHSCGDKNYTFHFYYGKGFSCFPKEFKRFLKEFKKREVKETAEEIKKLINYKKNLKFL